MTVLMTVFGATSSAAQVAGAAPRADFSLKGQVIGLGGDPVPSAEVTVVEEGSTTGRRLQADSAGMFSARGLAAATLSIRVRAFGYTPKSVTVTASAATRQATVTISLEPMATELAGMPITEGSPEYDSKLADYYARKASNSFAHFVDGADIVRRKPPFVSEMLRPMPGVVLTSTRMGNVVRIRGCAPMVWVDGIRMPGAQLDEVAAPADVAAIEIYNSFAGIPARYFDRTATCGTILVWLRQ